MTFFRTAVAAGCLAFAFVPSSHAESLITEAFVANLRPNVAFLEQSGQLALDRSQNSAVRAFAQTGMREANRVAVAVTTARSIEVAAGTGDTLVMGRSAAVDTTPALGQAANGRAPMGRADLDALAGLSGRKFLDAFWLKQLDALSQLRADYEDYADHGDDPALVALAKRELPEVERRLAQLAKI